MHQYTRTIEDYFHNNLLASIKEGMAKIVKLTSINRNETQICHYLQSMGMKPRQVGMLPAKADLEVLEEFKNNS